MAFPGADDDWKAFQISMETKLLPGSPPCLFLSGSIELQGKVALMNLCLVQRACETHGGNRCLPRDGSHHLFPAHCLWILESHGVWLIAYKNFVPDAVDWEYEQWVLSSGCWISRGELRAQKAQGFLHLSPWSVVHFTRSVFRCVHLNLKSWLSVVVSSLFDFGFLLQQLCKLRCVSIYCYFVLNKGEGLIR